MDRAKNYLVTGVLVQIGAELLPAPQRCYGADRAVDSDVRIPAAGDIDATLGVLAPFVQRQKKMSGPA